MEHTHGFGQLEKMVKGEITRQVYKSLIDVVGVWGWFPVQRKDWMMECMSDRESVRGGVWKGEVCGQE